MKLKIIAMMAALFFSANALAAIQITERQARNMDDVQSLGVIYINHNMATEHEAEQALSQMSDAQGAKYFQPILIDVYKRQRQVRAKDDGPDEHKQDRRHRGDHGERSNHARVDHQHHHPAQQAHAGEG